MLIDFIVLPLPSALLPCILLVPLPVLSQTTSLSSPSCLFRPPSVFVVFVCYMSRSPPVLSSLILCSSRSCLSSPLSKVSRPLPALSSRGRRWGTHLDTGGIWSCISLLCSLWYFKTATQKVCKISCSIILQVKYNVLTRKWNICVTFNNYSDNVLVSVDFHCIWNCCKTKNKFSIGDFLETSGR